MYEHQHMPAYVNIEIGELFAFGSALRQPGEDSDLPSAFQSRRTTVAVRSK